MRGLLATCLFAVIAVLATGLSLIDDAYISMRYARNLAVHGQLVFNLGERVEGITNLLWTLILAMPAAVSHDALPTVAIVLALALLVFAAVRLAGLGKLLGASPLASICASLVLLCGSETFAAATNGLEGALFIALAVEILRAFAAGEPARASLLAGLAFATRPEGLAIAAALALAEGLPERSWRAAARALKPFAAMATPLVAFRLLYFGALVPNSVTAKSPALSELSSGVARFYAISAAKYVAGFCLGNPALVISLLALAAIVSVRRQRGLAILCTLCILASCAAVLGNGGDWMPAHRLLSQYAPFYLAPALALPSGKLPAKLIPAAWLLCSVLHLAMQPWPFALRIHGAFEDPFLAGVVTRLRPVLAPSDVVSAEAIGFIGYQLENTVIHDPTGLTDKNIARYGVLAPTFGRESITYTLTAVRPSVAVWHWFGHVLRAPPQAANEYEVFCFSDCGDWNAKVAMIRRDRLPALEKAFDGWKHLRRTQ
jgi:arabinofuranosyltransferase